MPRTSNSTSILRASPVTGSNSSSHSTSNSNYITHVERSIDFHFRRLQLDRDRLQRQLNHNHSIMQRSMWKLQESFEPALDFSNIHQLQSYLSAAASSNNNNTGPGTGTGTGTGGGAKGRVFSKEKHSYFDQQNNNTTIAMNNNINPEYTLAEAIKPLAIQQQQQQQEQYSDEEDQYNSDDNNNNTDLASINNANPRFRLNSTTSINTVTSATTGSNNEEKTESVPAIESDSAIIALNNIIGPSPPLPIDNNNNNLTFSQRAAGIINKQLNSNTTNNTPDPAVAAAVDD